MTLGFLLPDEILIRQNLRGPVDMPASCAHILPPRSHLPPRYRCTSLSHRQARCSAAFCSALNPSPGFFDQRMATPIKIITV